MQYVSVQFMTYTISKGLAYIITLFTITSLIVTHPQQDLLFYVMGTATAQYAAKQKNTLKYAHTYTVPPPASAPALGLSTWNIYKSCCSSIETYFPSLRQVQGEGRPSRSILDSELKYSASKLFIYPSDFRFRTTVFLPLSHEWREKNICILLLH